MHKLEIFPLDQLLASVQCCVEKLFRRGQVKSTLDEAWRPSQVGAEREAPAFQPDPVGRSVDLSTWSVDFDLSTRCVALLQCAIVHAALSG